MRVFTSILIALFSFLSSQVCAEEKILTLGIFAFRPKPIMAAKYDMLGVYLTESLPNHKVKVEYLEQDEMEQALNAGRLDMVFTNPSHYVRLRHQNQLSGSIATLQAMENGRITSYLGGVILVPSESPIQKFSDLKHKKVAIPGKYFLGGFQTQAFELKEAGIDPFVDLNLFTSGSHDQVINDLRNHKVEAGFVRTGLIEQLIEQGKLSSGQLRVIGPKEFPNFPYATSTRLYPEWAFATLPHLSDETVKRINRALLFITSDMPVAQQAGIAGFTIPGDYQSVDQLARNLRLPPYETDEVSLSDIWIQYRVVLIGIALCIALIVALSIRLFHSRQKMHTAFARLERISSRLPGMIYEFKIDSGGHSYLPYVSDAVQSVFGVAKETVVGNAQGLFDQINPLDLPKVQSSIQESAEKLTPWHCSFRLKNNGAQVRWLSGNAIPQRHPDGSTTWHGYIQDITEEKTTHEKLSLAASVFEYANEGIMITSPSGEILDVNAAFTELTGYERSEVIGQNPRFLKSGLHAPEFYLEMWEELDKNGKWSSEVWNKRKNGELYVAKQTISVVKNDFGSPASFVALFTDYTAIREQQTYLEQLVKNRTEDLLVAKEAAEAASRAKSAFLSNMSHELRTPMHGILGMLSLAQQRMTDAKGLDQLKKAGQAADRLLGIINDVLDISKIEGEQLLMETIPFNLKSVLDNLFSAVGHTANGKALKVVIDIPRHLTQERFIGDPLRLEQILINIVGNSIKFTEQGSISVIIRSQDESLDALKLCFEVVDTGIGIDAEALNRLFNAFEQADNSMTRKYGGTGLGLAISKRLVTLMGGEIGVTSELGEGSKFWFNVRLKKQPMNDIGAESNSSLNDALNSLRQSFMGSRILLVEDEPINQEVATELLSDAGLAIDLAENGQQSVQYAQRTPYALILMDMRMPIMNGVEATKAIRADSLNQLTPVVAMTANVSTEDRQMCFEAGMNDHIPKPVDPDRLYETVLTWLSVGRNTK